MYCSNNGTFLALCLCVSVSASVGIKHWRVTERTEKQTIYRQDGVHQDYKTAYLEIPLDHFSYVISDTFRLRYLVCDSYFHGENDPIFFYTGNEGDIVWFYNNTGIMLEWAAEFRALVVFAEHRYYGESLPYGNDSYKDLQHLGYLSSEQALADFVYVIDHIKETFPGAANSPVVAFGGSYGGMLAAWLRMKYPHSVVGSLAASAPIWMFGDLVPCERFLEIVTQDFDKSGPNCVFNIRRSWKVINELGKTDVGRASMTQLFRLCNPLTSPSDVDDMKGWLSEAWVNLAMVDYPYPASFLEPLPAWPIKVVCSHLANDKWNDLELIAHLHDAVGVYYNYTGNMPCFNTNETATGNLGNAGWEFQTSTEMVMPICSDGIHDMFEPSRWNLTEFSEECRKNWNVLPRPDWIIKEYGGKNISSRSNIIFSNGDLDPWSAGGVLESPSPSLVAILIKDGAHHLDLRPSRPDDIPSVVEARAKEKSVISSWIDDYWKASTAAPSLDLAADVNVRVVGRPSSPCNFVRSTDTDATAASDELIVFLIVGAIFIAVLVSVVIFRQRKNSDDDTNLFLI